MACPKEPGGNEELIIIIIICVALCIFDLMDVIQYIFRSTKTSYDLEEQELSLFEPNGPYMLKEKIILFTSDAVELDDTGARHTQILVGILIFIEEQKQGMKKKYPLVFRNETVQAVTLAGWSDSDGGGWGHIFSGKGDHGNMFTRSFTLVPNHVQQKNTTLVDALKMT
ncbi:hypothetical protein ACJX0J_015548 [Zea mays]